MYFVKQACAHPGNFSATAAGSKIVQPLLKTILER